MLIGNHWDGSLLIAKLNHDPSDPRYKRLRFLHPDGHEFVMERKTFRLLNLTAYVKANYANKDIVGAFWER